MENVELVNQTVPRWNEIWKFQVDLKIGPFDYALSRGSPFFLSVRKLPTSIWL